MYTRLLGMQASLGRMTGRITGPSACSIVRSWNSSRGGVAKSAFSHIYNVSGQLICDCDDMVDARRFQNTSKYPTCIHVEALNSTSKRFDTRPLQEYGPLAVLLDDDEMSSVSVAISDKPFERGIVINNKKKKEYACLHPSCCHRQRSCPHIEALKNYAAEHSLHGTGPFLPLASSEQEQEPVPPMPPPPTSSRASISTTPIRLDYMVQRAKLRSAAMGAASQWIPHGNMCMPSTDGVCDACGASWVEATPGVKDPNGMLYGCFEAIGVAVYELLCRCGNKKQYDGLDDGVFNYSGKTLWLHETLMRYVDLMGEAKMPFNAYHSVLLRQYGRRGQSVMCSTNTLIASLEAFIQLLDVDYAHLYTCPICSQLPLSEQVYIIDGKAMGHRRDLAKHIPYTPPARGEETPIIPGTTYAYIRGDKESQKCAKLVRKYANGEHFDESLFSSMVRRSKVTAPELTDVLQYIKLTHARNNDFLQCPKRYRQFLYDLMTPCPISCLVPHTLAASIGTGIPSSLERMMSAPKLTAAEWKDLSQWGALGDALAGLDAIPRAFHPLLAKLLQLARIPDSMVQDAQTCIQTEVGLEDDELIFFPNHPKIRRLRTYGKETGPDVEATCTKKVLKSAHLTPGVFTAFCPHGIAIGFQALRDFESARIPFELFYTRFASAPGMIVYDNACNASRYCLRREPLFFSLVLFLIDRLHQLNHSSCHSGYCINSYPSSMPILGGKMTLQDLNSQAAEQCHAKMKLIEAQTRYMGPRTFLNYTKLFLALANKEILSKMHS